MKTVFHIFLIAALILPLMVTGEDDEYLQFQMDYARFRASEPWTLLEFYFSVPRGMLEHSKEGDTYEADYEFTVKLFKDDSTVSEKSWQRKDIVPTLDEITKKQHIMDSYGLYLQEGTYGYRIELKDIGKNTIRWHEGEIQIEPFSYEELDVSDIQLAYRINSSSTQQQYVKNGYFILPNPAAYYGQDHQILYYYAEIYNLSSYTSQTDSTYSVRTRIKDMNEQIVDEWGPTLNKRLGSSVVEIGRRKLMSLFSATFKLEITVIDNATGDSVRQSKRFFVLKPGALAQIEDDREEMNLNLDEYREMSEEELDAQFRKARYIAIGPEKEVYEELDLQSKQEFMARFWYRRDPDRSTPVNEFKKDYMDRVEMANARYSSGSKDGWRTDQGRILLTYGRPDEIERAYADLGERESEIWYYFSYQGGIEFVFVDVSGYGEMRLVHSTAVDELQDYDWRDRWKDQ